MLLLIAMLQGVVVAGLLLARGLRRKQTADLLLAALLFQLACSLIEHFIGFMGVYDYAREHGFDLTFFPFDNPFLYGPLILLYVKALTDRDFSWRRRDWAHFALPLIYLVVHFSIWSMPDAVKFQFLDEAFWGRVIQWVQQAGFYLTSIAYLTYAFRRFQSYRSLIEQEYANTGNITLDWLRLFLVAFSAYLGFDLLFSVVGHAFQFWYTGWYWLNLTRALLLYYISVTGWSFAQKSSVQLAVLEQRSVQAQEPATSNATGKLTMLPEAVEKLRPQLAQFMETERPWLDPELTLSVLAEKIGLNASQLSFLVNNGFQQNFNDFVNTYRVEEVKRKLNLPEYQHLSLLGVAFESGFNSKATFNRAFKKLTGNAPSQYAGLKS
ncbi:MAG: helix-turn-helix domain-containing protein [Saprospiraceae bacterium]